MKSLIRHTAEAFTLGAAVALVFDAFLQMLTTAIRVTGGLTSPWWARVAENSVWIALGLVIWLAAPLVGDWIDEFVPRAHISRRTIWELVGLGMLMVPPGHVIGTWIVLAIELTVSGGWASEGRIFLSSAYYGNVLLSITPWITGGAILRAWAHHMVPE